MKKRILLLTVCLVTAFALSACGNSNNTEDPDNVQDLQQQQEEQQQGNNNEDEDEKQQEETAKVKDIAGKKSAKVTALLGEPIQKEGDSYLYDGGVQVDYVDDKAVVITIIPAEKVSDTDFAAVFSAIGLKEPQTEPTTTDVSYVWENVSGFYNITVYRNNGFVDYYTIITAEKYKK